MQKLEQLKAERKSVKNDIKQLTIIAENNRSVLGDDFKGTSEHREKNDSYNRDK